MRSDFTVMFLNNLAVKGYLKRFAEASTGLPTTTGIYFTLGTRRLPRHHESVFGSN